MLETKKMKREVAAFVVAVVALLVAVSALEPRPSAPLRKLGSLDGYKEVVDRILDAAQNDTQGESKRRRTVAPD